MNSIRRKTINLATLVCICLLLSPLSIGQQKQDKESKDIAWGNVNSERVLWYRDRANSDTILVNSLSVRIISGHNSIDATVGMAFIDQGDYFLAYVYISNDGQERFEVDPQDFRIAYWKDKDAYLNRKPGDWSYSVAPEAVASKYKSRAQWNAFFVRLAGGMAATTVTTEQSGTVTVIDGSTVANGTYSGTSTTTVPDRRAQVAADANARRITNDAQGEASAILKTSLKANTVFPGEHVSGWVYFQRKKIGVGDVILRVIRSSGSSGPRAVDYCFLTGPRK